MKKILLALALSVSLGSYAQDEKLSFNHLSVGLSVGTTGFGIDLSTPVSSHLSLRGGVEFFPEVTVNGDITIDKPGDWYELAPVVREYYLPSDNTNIDIQGKGSWLNGNVLLDIYPSRKGTFHFTAGAYFGNSNIATIKARGEMLRGIEEFNSDVDNHIPGVGTEKFTEDGYEMGIDRGRIKMEITTGSIKPYVGIGFASRSQKSTVGCRFDLGMMFWGKPEIYDCYKGKAVSASDPKLKDDFKDVMDIADKLIAYPVMKFTLVGKIL